MARRGHSLEESVLSPFDALKRVGTSPEEIDLVIQTHLHPEHIGYGYLYKNAKFIIQKAELEFAYNPPVDTGKGKAIISGMCSLRENFDPPEEWRQHAPVIAPGVHTNLFDACESMMRIPCWDTLGR